MQLYDRVKVGRHNVIIQRTFKLSHSKEVYAVVYDLENRKRAILKVIKRNLDEIKNTIDFYLEKDIDYFVNVIDFDENRNIFYLLLKYYDQGSLNEYIKENYSKITEEESIRIIKRILEIGCYLHKNNYLHCDIKPGNFFVDGDGTIVLGDLESTIKVDNIKDYSIEKLLGTKGFKYAMKRYSLRDEMLAFIATIYYIDTGDYLIEPEDYNRLKTVSKINNFIKNKIETTISKKSLREILIKFVGYLEEKKSFTACDILKEFKSETPKEQKDDSSNKIFIIGGAIAIVIGLIFAIPKITGLTGGEIKDKFITYYQNIKGSISSIVSPKKVEDDNKTISKPVTPTIETTIPKEPEKNPKDNYIKCKEAYYLSSSAVGAKNIIKVKKGNGKYSLFEVKNGKIKEKSGGDQIIYYGIKTEGKNLCQNGKLPKDIEELKKGFSR